MPYARAIAPDVLATARAQCWEPAEVIKALLAEEIKGQARSMLAIRRKAAGFRTGKTFAFWDEAASSIPAPTRPARAPWKDPPERNLVVGGPSGTGKTFFLEALGQQAVEEGMRVAWFTLEDLAAPIRSHRADDTATRAVSRILRADLVVDEIYCQALCVLLALNCDYFNFELPLRIAKAGDEDCSCSWTMVPKVLGTGTGKSTWIAFVIDDVGVHLDDVAGGEPLSGQVGNEVGKNLVRLLGEGFRPGAVLPDSHLP